MVRSRALVSLLLVMLFGAVALWTAPVAVAQDATPEAGMEQGGISYTPVGFAGGVMLGSPADLIVVRMEVAPGASFPIEASDPTNTMAVIESGSLTIRVEEVEWTITRSAGLQAAMAAGAADMSSALESVAMGTEATLEAGDVAFVPGNVSGEVRNDGDAPVSALLFVIAPATAMEGTPTP